MTERRMTRKYFAVLVEQAGLTLLPQQFSELYAAYPRLAAMAEQVRGKVARPLASEIAPIFKVQRPSSQ
jgi:hypothetical protein